MLHCTDEHKNKDFEEDNGPLRKTALSKWSNPVPTSPLPDSQF